MNMPLSEGLNKETEEAVYFFTPTFYALDNFSAHIVEIWGRKFQTSEHAYQWKKYSESHPDIAEEILKATSPNQAKKIADAHKKDSTSKFHEIKISIMEEILKAKANQHEKVVRTLKETGSREIIENSPTDSFWGIGPEKNGQNMLGKLWMKIRDSLPE
jgi:ribA/ribD-fused uncharacterized protein